MKGHRSRLSYNLVMITLMLLVSLTSLSRTLEKPIKSSRLKASRLKPTKLPAPLDFDKLAAQAERYSYSLQAASDSLEESRSCYVLKKAGSFIPDLSFEAVVGHTGGINKYDMRFYWDTIFDSWDYYRRQVGFTLTYNLSDKLNGTLEAQDHYIECIGAANTHFSELVTFRSRLFLLIKNAQLQKEAVNAHSGALEVYTRAYEMVRNRSLGGEIANEASQNELTLGQLAARRAEAGMRLMEATKKLDSARQQLKLMVGMSMEEIAQVKLPSLNAQPKLSDLMKRNVELVEALTRLRGAENTAVRERGRAYIPRLSAVLSAKHSYIPFSETHINLPIKVDASVNASWNIASISAITSVQHAQYRVASARHQYFHQYTRALEKASEQRSAFAYNKKAMEAQETAVSENRREMIRLKEILKLDPYDQHSLQKYGEAASRYSEALERLENLTKTSVELYFRLMTPLSPELQKIKILSPKTRLLTRSERDRLR